MAFPALQLGRPAVLLAPMEGVTDAALRALAGEFGAFTFAVSEFLRVSHTVLPKHVVLRHVPELRHEGITPTGLPVAVQLLGGDPERMAASALNAVAAGATSIDLNFGCPAPTVNKHDGGATLLKYPQRLHDIVLSVRQAVPRNIPVSAKMRLGWDTIDAVIENANRAADAGASWITIHARTRTQGYAPPVFWPRIGEVRKNLTIPVVANGDIWTLDDFRRCRDATGCEHFMLGRGALARPGLSAAVAEELNIKHHNIYSIQHDWPVLLGRLLHWEKQYYPDAAPVRATRRLKQWLSLAAKHADFPHFDAIKRCQGPEELLRALRECSAARPTPTIASPASACGPSDRISAV
jgi:tRNA-dihydrouridine synthase C